MKAKNYNRDWSEFFELNEDSPSGLSWNCPRYYRGTPNYDRIGKPVGSVSKGRNKYWVVGLGGVGSYLIHRIKWVMMNGSVSDDQDIDNIDGDGLNNKSENLREVEKKVNCRNKAKRSDNKTGFNCIYYCKTRTGSGYQAQFTNINGLTKTKFYSEYKYGHDEALRLAKVWYDNQLTENNGYTDRHGK